MITNGNDLAYIVAQQYEYMFHDTWYSRDTGIEIYIVMFVSELGRHENNFCIQSCVGTIRAAMRDNNVIYLKVGNVVEDFYKYYSVRFIFDQIYSQSIPSSKLCNSYLRFYYRHIRNSNLLMIFNGFIHDFMRAIFKKYLVVRKILLPDLINYIFSYLLNQQLYVL